jgi:hypothetical protein
MKKHGTQRVVNLGYRCRWGAGIVQWYSAELRPGWSGVRLPAGAGNFSLHHRVQNGSGAHPASYPMGNKCSFSGVKRPGREADHSPPSSAEVNSAWTYTSTPQYTFMAWRSVKAEGQLIDEGEWSASCSGRYIPRDGRLGRPQSRSGRGGEQNKNPPLLRIESRSLRP